MSKKYFKALVLSLISTFVLAQKGGKPVPTFSNCSDKPSEACFYNTIQEFIYQEFSLPENEKKNNYRGTVYALIQVDTIGNFTTTYVDADSPELKQATRDVISKLPTVKPVENEGNKQIYRYSLRINIPLQHIAWKDSEQVNLLKDNSKSNYINDRKELNEINGLKTKPYTNDLHKSFVNIPFSHSYYTEFDPYLNQIGANTHTASKPLHYAEVAKYYDFDKRYNDIKLNKESWFGKKLFNENLVAIKGNNYWFVLNPVWDLRVGKDFNSDLKYTYNNTRALNVHGQLGKNLSFTATVFESQGRFADYYNSYADSMKPDGGNPAIIPGIGIAKRFKTDAYDYPSADANISYTPNDFFNLQLGYGRNFIGDGYRSLITSDVASPYPFFKINTTFWKIKYTNTYMWLKDPRTEVTSEKTYATKYMANHYLSWNVTNRWNLGFFETVVWNNTNNRGFDVNFVNPIIFYRSVEFTSSSRSGNAALGLTSKYKFTTNFNIYGQLFLDELSVKDFTGGQNSWKNKYAFQIGGKYYDAFKIKNLTLQAEYNYVRPYTYSHSSVITNYGHNNQSMAHLWGANFREFVAIARYFKGRWYTDAKLIVGTKGLDYNDGVNTTNYGSNPYLSYDDNRYQDINVKVGQGIKTTILNAELQTGYLLNPTMNLKLFGSLQYRSFSPEKETINVSKSNTTWFQVGLRSDIFNSYSDF